MTRKERKRVRKEQRRVKNAHLHTEEFNQMCWDVARGLRRSTEKRAFGNETFICKKTKQIGCFPACGGYKDDVFLCEHCQAKDYCLKIKYPPKHRININEWRIANEKGR